MELLNQADGPVMTMLAGMSEDVDDEDIKEELMCCFSMHLLQFKLSKF